MLQLQAERLASPLVSITLAIPGDSAMVGQPVGDKCNTVYQRLLFLGGQIPSTISSITPMPIKTPVKGHLH